MAKDDEAAERSGFVGRGGHGHGATHGRGVHSARAELTEPQAKPKVKRKRSGKRSDKRKEAGDDAGTGQE